MTTTDAAPLEYRPFLDGLRAFAVLAVIAYHVDGAALPGGFLGVDVFFVLSGYLITRLLLAEKARHGRVDFLEFYARRARRLLPAVLLVLAVVVFASQWLYDPMARYTITRDATASLLYVANWSFVVNGQSYFDAFTDPSPLRHLWSLAVEEQFYLVWPVAVAALPLRGRRGLAIVAVLAAGSAVALAILHDPDAPSRAYYGTDARLHEPLIGAFAALLSVRLDPGLTWLRHAALPCAAALVAFMVLLNDQAAGYYRGLSVLFCAITALFVLALEAPHRQLPKAVLSSRPAVWLGKISYGMYLWHWPILIALSRTSLRPPERSVAVVALTIAIAALSYHLLERPIRTARTALGRPISSRGVLLGALAAIVLFGGVLALRLRGSEPPAWAGDTMTVTGSGSYRIALIGDSIVRSTAPGWQEVAAREGWTLIDGSMGGCSIAGGFQVNSIGKKYGFSKKCRHETPRVLDETAAQRPDLVIWQSHSEVNGLMDLATNQPHQPGSPEHDAMLQQGWETAWARFKDVDVVIVEAVPAGPRREQSCADDPAMCADDGTSGLIAHLNDLLRDFASKHPRVRFVRIAEAVCPDGPPCPRTIDGITIRHDGYHYTPEAAPLVVNAITSQILPIMPVKRPP